MEERRILGRLLVERKRDDKIMIDPDAPTHNPRGPTVRLPGKDEVLDVLKRVLASRFRLNGIVILDAPDDTAPFEVVPAFDVREVIASLPKVVDPEPREVRVGSHLANRRGSALLADRQRS